MNHNIFNFVQVTASVGILLGLILVGVQIKEATRIAEAQFSYDAFTGAIDSQALVIGEHLGAAWARAKVNSPDLTDHDLVVIEAFLIREWLHNVRSLQLANAGFGSTSDLDISANKWVYTYLGNKTALRWWQRMKENGSFFQMHPELSNKIETMVDEFNGDLSSFHAEGLRSLRTD